MHVQAVGATPWDFAALNENFMCAPITQPKVATDQYEIKPHLVTMV